MKSCDYLLTPSGHDKKLHQNIPYPTTSCKNFQNKCILKKLLETRITICPKAGWEYRLLFLFFCEKNTINQNLIGSRSSIFVGRGFRKQEVWRNIYFG